jgi:PAS domain S-box-containing protein
MDIGGETRKISGKIKLSVWGGYFFAIIIVVLATWLKDLAEPNIIPANIPILYILAIVLTSFLFETGPSILCCVLSLLAFDYFFIVPLHSFKTFHILEVPVLAIFLFVGLVISYLSSKLRQRTMEARREINIRKKSEAELISYRENLEDMVKQRTEELEKANTDLKQEIRERREAEEMLRQSEERFRVIAEASPIQISVSRQDGSILFTNKAYNEAFGFKEGELVGRQAPDLYANQEDRDSLLQALREQGALKDYEVMVKHSDGTAFWISTSVSPIQFSGEPAILGASLDITERKEIEEILQKAYDQLEIRVQERTRELANVNRSLENEIAEHKKTQEVIAIERQRFNDVLNMLPAYVVLLSPDYYVPFANRFFEERFGKSEGKRCYEYLFHRNEPCENCESFKVLKTKSPHHWEWLGPDGHNYDIFDFPFTDTDGSPLIMEMGIDITIQKQAQGALLKAHDELERRVQERTSELAKTNKLFEGEIAERKQAEEREKQAAQVWQITFDSISDMISIQDTDNRLIRVNRAYAQAVGATPEELRGKTCYSVVHDTVCPIEGCPHRETLETGKTITREIFEPRFGTYFEVTTSPIFSHAGQLAGSVHIVRDISERKKAEQLKDEFIGLVSHELRTPMTVINGSLRTAMTAGISPQDQKDMLENAIYGAGELSAILDNLLELSRSQAGRLQIHKENVNIPDITDIVIQDLKSRKENRSFRMDFPPTLPPVEADPMRVERILYNLMENAIKYSPDNSEIRVFAQHEGNMVLTGVTDQGAGINEENRQKIFEPFERLGKGDRSQGLGLGLVVCKRLVEAQGGKIWVESTAGRGSTFYFTLPVYQVND